MTDRPRTRRRTALPAAVLALLAAGCGVPTGQTATTVAAAEVPYGLLNEASPAPPPEPSDPAVTDPHRAFFVTDADRLVGVPLDAVLGAAPLPHALTALSAGPDRDRRPRGLGTAIPPGLSVAVTRLDRGTATVDLRGEPVPAGEQGPLAVAQIVLTATSVPTVDRVLLTRDGAPLEAPLPDGGLAAAPLTTPCSRRRRERQTPGHEAQHLERTSCRR